MKKLIFLFLSLIIILGISSCNNKTYPIEDKKATQFNNTNGTRTSENTNNTGTTQSVPKISILENDSSLQPSPSKESDEAAKKPSSTETSKNTASKKETSKKKAHKITPLGQYSTPLLNKNKDRIANIKLAARKINGYKLEPGDTFSFNAIVGKRDDEHGFKVATIIINGEFDKDIGGGVCQLSGTLYNAADNAKLEIIERHSHSGHVSYIPEGRDAAVSYDYLDLKFKNNKDFPIKIKTWVKEGKVYAAIYKSK